MESTARGLPPGVDGTMVDADGVTAELQAVSDAGKEKLVIYFHGGGYIGGSIASHRNLTGHLALQSNLRVLSVEYRLAPEHPHPAPVEDAVTTYQWALSQGYQAADIVLAGDSAGGGLTAGCLVSLREQQLPLPAAGVLISPWLDMSLSGDSMATNDDNDASISAISMPRTRELFVTEDQISDPLASPLEAQLAGLPPLLIHVGDEEVLLSDSQRFTEKATAAGVSVDLQVWPEMFHVWHACVGLFEEATAAIDNIAEFIHQRFEAPNE